MACDETGEAQSHRGKHAVPVHEQRRGGEVGGRGPSAGADIIEVIGKGAKLRGKVLLDVAGKKKGDRVGQHCGSRYLSSVEEGSQTADLVGGPWWRLRPLMDRRDALGGVPDYEGQGHDPTSTMSCELNAGFSKP
jgi:hypothetical protein